MKTRILTLSMGFMLLAATSCSKKCVTCTGSSGADNKYCSQSGSDRDDFVKAHTLAGETCRDSAL